MKRFPATFSILGISLLIRVLSVFHPSIIDRLAFHPDTLQGWLNIVSYQFTHPGWDHILSNFTIGLPFMLWVEYNLGSLCFAEYFVLCGALAAIVQVAVMGPCYCVGASGSLFGIKMGSCLMFGDSKSEHWLSMALLGLLLSPQLTAAPYAALTNIAVWGHIGGALGGIIFLHKLYTPKAIA